MSDELGMEIIENLSEELGEKELKLMALEKELEKEKSLRIQMTELSEIQQYKIDYMEVLGYEHDKWTPEWIILENTEDDDELMIKTILHYFGGKVMTNVQIIKKYGHIDFDEEGAIPGVQIEDLENIHTNRTTGEIINTFWVCEK